MRSTSSISARTSRVISVIWNRPSVIAGRISALRPEAVSRPVRQKPSATDLAAAERGQHAERHREEVDQQDADQEGRQRDADQRYGEEHLGQPAVAVDAGVDAHRDAERDREQRGCEGELHRCRASDRAMRPVTGCFNW